MDQPLTVGAKTRGEHLLDDASQRFNPSYWNVQATGSLRDALERVIDVKKNKVFKAVLKKIRRPDRTPEAHEEAVAEFGEGIRSGLQKHHAEGRAHWTSHGFLHIGKEFIQVSTETVADCAVAYDLLSCVAGGQARCCYYSNSEWAVDKTGLLASCSWLHGGQKS